MKSHSSSARQDGSVLGVAFGIGEDATGYWRFILARGIIQSMQHLAITRSSDRFPMYGTIRTAQTEKAFLNDQILIVMNTSENGRKTQSVTTVNEADLLNSSEGTQVNIQVKLDQVIVEHQAYWHSKLWA